MHRRHAEPRTQDQRGSSLIRGAKRRTGARIAAFGVSALAAGQLLLPGAAPAAEMPEPAPQPEAEEPAAGPAPAKAAAVVKPAETALPATGDNGAMAVALGAAGAAAAAAAGAFGAAQSIVAPSPRPLRRRARSATAKRRLSAARKSSMP